MTGIDSDLLQRHDRFVRDLARCLVRDQATADDLAQDTMLSAMRVDLRAVHNVRGWLRATLQNCLAMHRRGRARAAAHEAGHAGGDPAPAADDVVHRIHEQRELLTAVERLDEPFRTAIVLRFFESLPPRAIARRLGVPVETVRSRVQRGLVKLRERLDRQHGSRAAWCVPLSSWCLSSPTPALLAMTLPTHTKFLSAIVAVVTCAFGVWWCTDGAPAAPAAPAPSSPESTRVVTANATPAAAAPALDRQRAADGATVPVRENTPSPTRVRITGRVFTVDAAPLGAVVVEQRGDPSGERATTAADGTFGLSVHALGGNVVVADPAWRTVLAGTTGGTTAGERVLVVGPALRVDGRVVDETGLPIEAARVRFVLPNDFRSRFAAVLDWSGNEEFAAVTTADGRFRLPDCARVGGATLAVHHDAFRPLEQSLDGDPRDLLLVLRRPVADAATLRGQVVDERDLPVVGAFVAGGDTATVSDERGEFVLERTKVRSLRRLVASKRGMMPAAVDLATAGPYVLLRLRSTSAELAGVVVDATGTPLANAKVWVADATFLGAAGGLDSSCEGIAGGGLGLAEHRASEAAIEELPPLEAAARRQPSALWCFVRTGADGHFRLEGLAERDYRLRAQDPNTLQTIELGPFPAGRTDLRLVMPADGVFAKVTGRVVTGDGRPLAGASVVVRVRSLALRIDRTTTTYRNELRDEVLCDDDGRFTLVRVPKDAVLVVQADDVEPTGFGGEGEVPFAAQATGPIVDGHVDLLLPCVARCSVRVELAGDPSRADEVTFVDAAGNVVWFLRIEGGSVDRENRAPLHDGRSAPLNVPANAVAAVLHRAGHEVERLPIVLRAGAANVVR